MKALNNKNMVTSNAALLRLFKNYLSTCQTTQSALNTCQHSVRVLGSSQQNGQDRVTCFMRQNFNNK